jgi:hypothetical protein
MPRRKISDVQVGTTCVQSAKLMVFEMKWTTEIVEVEPLRLVRLHSDWGPTEAASGSNPAERSGRVVPPALA